MIVLFQFLTLLAYHINLYILKIIYLLTNIKIYVTEYLHCQELKINSDSLLDQEYRYLNRRKEHTRHEHLNESIIQQSPCTLYPFINLDFEKWVEVVDVTYSDYVFAYHYTFEHIKYSKEEIDYLRNAQVFKAYQDTYVNTNRQEYFEIKSGVIVIDGIGVPVVKCGKWNFKINDSVKDILMWHEDVNINEHELDNTTLPEMNEKKLNDFDLLKLYKHILIGIECKYNLLANVLNGVIIYIYDLSIYSYISSEFTDGWHFFNEIIEPNQFELILIFDSCHTCREFPSIKPNITEEYKDICKTECLFIDD